MHINSKHQLFSFLTQFFPLWVKKWCLLPFLSTFLYLIGRFMPWEHPLLYPVQTILLVQPLWVACLWPCWTLWIGRKWSFAMQWSTRLLSVLLAFWALGGFAPRGSVTGDVVLIANVNAYAGEQDMLQGYLSMLGVPRLILVEKRAEEISGFTRVADDFDAVVKKPSHHTAVFCSDDCSAWVSPQIGSSTMSMSLAVMALSNNVCLIAVHVPPPTPIDATGMRPYIDYVTSVLEEGRLLRDWEVCNQGDLVLVGGDFNAVEGSWAHRELLASGLTDAQGHTGLRGATWPSESKDFVQFPIFRIDHVLHHPNLDVSVQQIRIPHSDHQGLLLTVQLSQQ